MQESGRAGEQESRRAGGQEGRRAGEQENRSVRRVGEQERSSQESRIVGDLGLGQDC